MATTDDENTENENDYLQELTYEIPDADETTCSICHAEFLDPEDLTVHVNQMHKKLYTHDTDIIAQTTTDTRSTTPPASYCQFCDATCRDFDDYARHICVDHLIQLFCCRVCTKCFVDGAKWKRHEKKHKNKSNTFACSQCVAVFSTPKEVEVHEIINHDNKDDGVFVTCMPHLSAFLRQNAVAFLQSEDRALFCTTCKFRTAEIDSFLKHTKKECVVYVCDICCHVTFEKKYLLKHLNRKNRCKYPHECDSEMTTCLTCKMELHSRHMQAHLNTCNRYKCYICDVRFATIEGLSMHQSEVHPVELDVIKCKFCGKEFVGEVSLEKHMKRSHSHQFILYKYKCMTCNHIFKHPQVLFAHYFTKHKELEPYTCRICDKKFKIRKRFTIHIKLEHKSAGVVEFDEQYHVFFAEKKSENPFIPKCVIPELVPVKNSTPTIKVKTQKEINAEVAENDLLGDTEVDEGNDLVVERKIKPKGKKRKREETIDLYSSSEEEAAPLSKLKKSAERKWFQRRFPPGSKKVNQHLNQRRHFTCKDCKKYCYTYQNYHNHIQLHKKEYIKCVKCAKRFKSKNKLSEHMKKDHATSKLTETLKNVLERKQYESYADADDERNDEDLTPSERFMKTIKKVKPDKQAVSATIAPSSGDLSVKNFIENFVPDVGESANVETTEMNDEEEPVVTLKNYDSPFYRKHMITMTKFTPEPPQTSFKLKMPEKFKASPQEKVKLKVRLVQEPLKVSMFEQMESFQAKFSKFDNEDNHQDYDDVDNNDHYDDGNDIIPEVAQEVMLEGTEEPPKPTHQAPHKIVIPKLPDGYPKIHIATLQPEAPFFKIITVKNAENANEAIVIDTERMKGNKPKKDPVKRKDVISLPDGSKFVTANPLAHLLGGKPVEDLQISTKYYKPAVKNFKGLFAEALRNLDKPVKVKNVKKTLEAEVKPIRDVGEGGGKFLKVKRPDTETKAKKDVSAGKLIKVKQPETVVEINKEVADVGKSLPIL